MSEWEINLQIPAEPAWVLINSVNEWRKEPKLGMCTCLKHIYLTVLIKTFCTILNWQSEAVPKHLKADLFTGPKRPRRASSSIYTVKNTPRPSRQEGKAWKKQESAHPEVHRCATDVTQLIKNKFSVTSDSWNQTQTCCWTSDCNLNPKGDAVIFTGAWGYY